MTHKLKALGLALVAVFAFGAMSTSLASAHTPAEFTTTAGATIEAGPGQAVTHTLSVTGTSLTCTEAAFDGVAPGASFTSIDVTARYGGHCVTNLGTTATITGFASKVGEEGKCWYTINADTSAELKCKGGDVTIDAATCVVHIPAQKFPVGSLKFTNSSGVIPDDILLSFNIKNIVATHTDGFLCPFGSSGESNTASFTGSSTVIATVGEVQVNATYDPTVP